MLLRHISKKPLLKITIKNWLETAMELTRHSIQTDHAITYIPILSNSELNDQKKSFMAIFLNLCKATGYCYATNGYLIELTGKSLATVKRAIKNWRN